MDWQQGMNKAIGYIENHLRDEIDDAKAAQYVACSAWEFRRVFSFMAQIPLSEYIRRRRLTLAAHDIQAGKERIIDIALRYGYESQAAFTRAFRQQHGISPVSARRDGVLLKAYPRLTFQFVIQGVDELEFKLEKKEAFDVVGYSICTTAAGNTHYGDIGQFWERFHRDNLWSTLQACAKDPDECYAYAVSSYDDNVKAADFCYTIGVPYNGKPHTGDMGVIPIPAGTYAIFQMPEGEEAGAFTARIFREWLPASGYRLTGGPELELSASKTDAIIWLPVMEG